jgi:hypothetical protein
MKAVLAVLLMAGLALAGAQIPAGTQGGIHNQLGQLTGTFYVPLTTLVTWPYPDTGQPGQEWTWGSGHYTNANGDELFMTVIAWNMDWVPIAWHWEKWVENPSPPGGRIKFSEGDMY